MFSGESLTPNGPYKELSTIRRSRDVTYSNTILEHRCGRIFQQFPVKYYNLERILCNSTQMNCVWAERRNNAHETVKFRSTVKHL